MPDTGKNNSWYSSLERLVRYRLFVPIKRSKQPPEHAARGVAVGMFWAMTPFFGIQMALVFMTWVFTRKVFKWDFAVIPGLAWTWITNVFTLLPFFYAFYLTGQLALGQIGSSSGYEVFVNAFNQVKNSAGTGFLEQLYASVYVIISDIGLPLSVGSLIWAIIWSWVAYYVTLRFVIQYRARRGDNGMNAVL